MSEKIQEKNAEGLVEDNTKETSQKSAVKSEAQKGRRGRAQAIKKATATKDKEKVQKKEQTQEKDQNVTKDTSVATNEKASVKSEEPTKEAVIANPDQQVMNVLKKSKSFTGVNDPLPDYLL